MKREMEMKEKCMLTTTLSMSAMIIMIIMNTFDLTWYSQKPNYFYENNGVLQSIVK